MSLRAHCSVLTKRMVLKVVCGSHLKSSQNI
jgi:hypothetical protein